MSAVTFSGPFEVLPGFVSDGFRFTAIFEDSDPLMWFSYALDLLVLCNGNGIQL